MSRPDLVNNPSVVVSCVHARLLITKGDQVLAVGDPLVLPGGSPRLPDGPVRQWPDLAVAAVQQARLQSGLIARAGGILAVTVSAEAGLTLVFDAHVDDLGDARFVDASLVPSAAEAVKAWREHRIVYSERLWWIVQPSGGRNGLLPRGLGQLLMNVQDVDVTAWSLGCCFTSSPTDCRFLPFKGIWWSNNDPMYETGEALHQVLMALGRAGVLEEDAAVEFCWSSRVDVQTVEPPPV